MGAAYVEAASSSREKYLDHLMYPAFGMAVATSRLFNCVLYTLLEVSERYTCPDWLLIIKLYISTARELHSPRRFKQKHGFKYHPFGQLLIRIRAKFYANTINYFLTTGTIVYGDILASFPFFYTNLLPLCLLSILLAFSYRTWRFPPFLFSINSNFFLYLSFLSL